MHRYRYCKNQHLVVLCNFWTSLVSDPHLLLRIAFSRVTSCICTSIHTFYVTRYAT